MADFRNFPDAGKSMDQNIYFVRGDLERSLNEYFSSGAGRGSACGNFDESPLSVPSGNLFGNNTSNLSQNYMNDGYASSSSNYNEYGQASSRRPDNIWQHQQHRDNINRYSDSNYRNRDNFDRRDDSGPKNNQRFERSNDGYDNNSGYRKNDEYGGNKLDSRKNNTQFKNKSQLGNSNNGGIKRPYNRNNVNDTFATFHSGNVKDPSNCGSSTYKIPRINKTSSPKLSSDLLTSKNDSNSSSTQNKTKVDPEKYWTKYWGKYGYIEKVIERIDENDDAIKPFIKFIYEPSDEKFEQRKKLLLNVGVDMIYRNMDIDEVNWEYRHVYKVFVYKKHLEDPNFQKHLNAFEMANVEEALNCFKNKVKLTLLHQSFLCRWDHSNQVVLRAQKTKNYIRTINATKLLNDKLFHYLVLESIHELKQITAEEWPAFYEFYDNLPSNRPNENESPTTSVERETPSSKK